jgi:hypothetical protein
MAQDAKFLPVPAAEPMPTQLLSYKSSSLGVRIQAVLNGTIDELHRTELAQIRKVFKSHEERQRIMQHNTDVRQRLADWDQLAKLARYERRALSRRNAAIRAFDELRVSAGKEIG